jgi:hypothetical protein
MNTEHLPRPLLLLAYYAAPALAAAPGSAIIHAGRLHLYGACPVPPDATVSSAWVKWEDQGVAVTLMADPPCADISPEMYAHLVECASRLGGMDMADVTIRSLAGSDTVEVGVHHRTGAIMAQLAPESASIGRGPTTSWVRWPVSPGVEVCAYIHHTKE